MIPLRASSGAPTWERESARVPGYRVTAGSTAILESHSLRGWWPFQGFCSLLVERTVIHWQALGLSIPQTSFSPKGWRETISMDAPASVQDGFLLWL